MMKNSKKNILWLLAFFTAFPGIAEEYISDAYGVYIANDEVRQKWSGLQKKCAAFRHDCKEINHPPAALDRIEHFIGQKSLTVGHEISMSVIIAEDEIGNLIQGGEVEFFLRNQTDAGIGDIKAGLAYLIAPSGTISGYFDSSAQSLNHQTRRDLYRQIPDIRSIKISSEQPKYMAQKGALYELQTKPLFDRYKNPAPAGMLVKNIMQDEDGRYYIQPLMTIEERAKAIGYTNGMSGDLLAKLNLGNEESPAFSIEITPVFLLTNPDITANWEEKRQLLNIHIGNIRTNQGYLVQDATHFQLEIIEADQKKTTSSLWSVNGELSDRFALHHDSFPIRIILKSEFGDLEARITQKDLRNVATQ